VILVALADYIVHHEGPQYFGYVGDNNSVNNHEPHGDLAAFEVDICRAVAAAVLGSADKAKFIRFNDDDESAAGLRADKVDMLVLASPSVTGSFAGFAFGPIIFYDPVTETCAAIQHRAAHLIVASRWLMLITEGSR